MNEALLKPRRPYLLRAFYDWLIDNEFTPHLVVDATLPGVDVPFEYVQDGQIVLNVAPQSVLNLELGNENIRFSAKFGGHSISIEVPVYAIIAIYARENGAGTMFEPEPAYETLLESMELGLEAVEEAILEASDEDGGDELLLTLLEDIKLDNEPPPPDKKRPKGPPTLTVVK